MPPQNGHRGDAGSAAVTDQPVTSKGEGALEGAEDLFSRCSADLHRYVRRRLRRSADAADLTQEIFERFLRGDWRFRARNPLAYLFGIASNVVADARLAERRDIVTYDSDASHKASERMPDAAAGGAEHIALVDELNAALERLSDVHRVALLLTKRDGLSCKEAALRMRTTEGSVRVYVCEARAQLKMLLRKD